MRRLVVLNKKKTILRFGFGVLGPWYHDWGMFCGYFDDVIIRFQRADIVAQSFFGF